MSIGPEEAEMYLPLHILLEGLTPSMPPSVKCNGRSVLIRASPVRSLVVLYN